MENFYNTINNNKKLFKRLNSIIDKGLLDYFLSTKLELLIEQAINNIDINRVDAYKKLSKVYVVEDISISKQYLENFMSAYYGIDINKEDYGYIISKITNILRSYDIGSLKDKDDNNAEYAINTNLEKLIDIYNIEINNISTEIKKDYYSLINNTINNYEVVSNEEIISKLFYDEFINDRIVKIIRDAIKGMNINNYTKDDLPLNYRLYIRNKSSMGNVGSSLDIVVPAEFFKLYIKIVQDYIENYSIGKTNYNSLAQCYEINIKTTLNNLLNAYYMENQRVDYLSEEKPKVLTKK